MIRTCLILRKLLLCTTCPTAALFFLLSPLKGSETEEAGLLFYLSGDRGFEADIAHGEGVPAALQDIEVIEDGAEGPGFRCPHFTQILAYSAPGNLYAQRGTVSFFWRARDAIGRTPFPIFQASSSDHSTVDMAWMRIDFNGEGFDAFVTDASLARVRVSYQTEDLPSAHEWTHFAFGWDETVGVRFYVNGQLVGQKDTRAIFYAGLDKFGAHGDAIGPQDVVTMEQYQRGGDIDEIRIYDQMLSKEDIERLSRGQRPLDLAPVIRDLSDARWRQEWWYRYGWNRQEDPPPYLAAPSVKVRKVEIHDVYDLKQWFWKGTDGIRETTWPGVYNRSQLPGRNDYFPRPDWNCYSLSGKSVTFTLPDESWNHVEISGSAYGQLSYLSFDKEKQEDQERLLFERVEGQERTYHRLSEPRQGGRIRFVNEEQEMPIGEFSVYQVEAGRAPQGIAQLEYRLTGEVEADNRTLESLVDYIEGRFLPDERQIMVALPAGAPAAAGRQQVKHALPLIHVVVPFEFRWETRPSGTQALSTQLQQRVSMAQADSAVGGYSSKYSYTWENLNGGLDGIILELPALDVEPTHGEYYPINLQLRDPLWPDRNLIDFTFSVKPGEAKTLWLDSRDRILPNGYPLYLQIAGAGSDFGPRVLEGARLRLVFKKRREAALEHEVDRFTQVKDNQGHIVEWHTNKKTLRMYLRLGLDLTDLFKLNPDHEKGRYYWSYINPEQGWPEFEQPKGPEDVPLWAFRQVELVKLLREFIDWWIDNRQIENGEFGGGLSDDSDMTHLWVGAALMGIAPQKLTDSVDRMLDAIYDNGMFSNGLNTIMTDQLHTYEEGINVQPQVMQLKWGDPKTVERMMETARGLEWITGISEKGHRHIRSSYFSGTRISQDPVWARAKLNFYSHLILHPGLMLVQYNGHPRVKKLMLELADGILAHRRPDEQGNYYLPGEILFPSCEEVSSSYSSDVAHLLWAAWRWTGEEKYLLPIVDSTDQGDAFDVVRYLGANLLDFLDRRETWGRRLLSVLREGRVDELGPEPQTLSWAPTWRTRASFFRHVSWQLTDDKRYLEDYYAEQIQYEAQRMPMFTEDHWWIDMTGFLSQELQRSRLGGLAAFRMLTYPGQLISWRLQEPARAESVAILVPQGDPRRLKVIAFNLEEVAVEAEMTAWELDPGMWKMKVGIDRDGDDEIDEMRREETIRLERGRSVEVEFAPKQSTILVLELESPGESPWQRPDLGIGNDDVQVGGNQIEVRVHSLGSVPAPSSRLVLEDPSGRQVAEAVVPALEAPLDLEPRTVVVALPVPGGTGALSGYSVRVELAAQEENTKNNNRVVLQ